MGNQATTSKAANYPAGADDATASDTTFAAEDFSPTTIWRWDTKTTTQDTSDPFSPTTKCIKQKMKDPAVMAKDSAC